MKNRRTIAEYLIVAPIFYAFKNVIFCYFDSDEIFILNKGCLLVGILCIAMCIWMAFEERKSRKDFSTGDPVCQKPFSSDEELERAKAELPSTYWWMRAQLQREYVMVSVGVFAGFGVGLVSWSHLTFAVIYGVGLFALYAERESKMQLQMMEIRNDLLEDKYRSIHEIYSNNAKLYHDMNNHFQILYQLLEAEKLKDAKEYLSKIGEPMTLLSKNVWTGNEILDVIINNKIDEMKKRKIAYKVNVELFTMCGIEIHDLSMILYNLMDNAIETTERMESEKKICLTIQCVKQFLALKVTNPCEKSFTFLGTYPKTTKKDKEIHGWGLKSVSDIVKRYDGSMNCANKDGMFEVMILIPMNM